MVVKLWNGIQSDTLRARETRQRHSGIIKLQDYLLASTQTNTSIMRFPCKIAINVTPIVRLRLVDSHISTCLIRLRFALVVLSRFISCESLRRIVREQKETGKKKKKGMEGEKVERKKKGARINVSFDFIVAIRSFSLGSMNVLRTHQSRYIRNGIDIELRNGALTIRLWTFARCILHVYCFSRGNFFPFTVTTQTLHRGIL